MHSEIIQEKIEKLRKMYINMSEVLSGVQCNCDAKRPLEKLRFYLEQQLFLIVGLVTSNKIAGDDTTNVSIFEIPSATREELISLAKHQHKAMINLTVYHGFSSFFSDPLTDILCNEIDRYCLAIIGFAHLYVLEKPIED